MGCDIHLVLEKRGKDGRWIGIDTYSGHQCGASGETKWEWPIATNRHYRRFALLAGVRGDGPPPKGLPDDISETGKFVADSWAGDGHSHSWLPLDEATRIFVESDKDDAPEENPDTRPYLAAVSGDNPPAPPEPSYKDKYPESYYFGVDIHEENPIESYRIIFWFDN